MLALPDLATDKSPTPTPKYTPRAAWSPVEFSQTFSLIVFSFLLHFVSNWNDIQETVLISGIAPKVGVPRSSMFSLRVGN